MDLDDEDLEDEEDYEMRLQQADIDYHIAEVLRQVRMLGCLFAATPPLDVRTHAHTSRSSGRGAS